MEEELLICLDCGCHLFEYHGDILECLNCHSTFDVDEIERREGLCLQK